MRSKFPGFALLTAIFLMTASAAWAGGAKVQVCHIPPGNPANFHTITISENALQAHLGHGDLAGACFAHCDTLCSDGNPCTIDACNASEQCLNTHPPVNCDDGNLCTTDSCNSVTGCASVPKLCTDSDNCTVNACDPVTGSCVAPPVACSAGQSCNPENGQCGTAFDCPCLAPGFFFAEILAGEVTLSACSVGANPDVDDAVGVFVSSPELPFSGRVYSASFPSFGGTWLCAGPPASSGIVVTPAQGQECAELLEQEANRQGVPCLPF